MSEIGTGRVKGNQNIQLINIFDHDFLSTAYPDDVELLGTIEFLNKSKWRIAEIGILLGVKVALCGLKYLKDSSESFQR